MSTTTKRERHVYPSDEIPHLWANRTQDSARNSCGNVSFSGDDLYSYGTLIGRHVTSARGEHAVLLTTQRYSVTTTKLQSEARSATSHLRVFHVHNVRMTKADAPMQFEAYASQLADLCLRFDRARVNRPGILAQIHQVIDEANDFAKFYGLRSRLGGDSIGDMSESAKRVDAKAKRRDARLQRAADKLNAEHREAWLAGEPRSYPDAYNSPVKLRILTDSEEIQSSRGARVPVKHAVRLLRLIRLCRENHTGWVHNGHTEHVGAYSVDSIDDQGNITIGCHVIEYAEIERIAKLLEIL